MEACLVCKKAPKKVSHFCSRSCAQAAQQNAPGLLEVPEDHVTFRSGVLNFYLQSLFVYLITTYM